MADADLRQMLERARSLHMQGSHAESEVLYRRLLERRPNLVLALEGLGVLLFQQGRTADAAALFQRGVAVKPDAARMHANLAEALRVLGRQDEALDHLHKASAIDPSLSQIWNTRGLIAYDAGRYAEAEAAYREAIRREPRLAAAYINLANAMQSLHRSGEAIDALKTALVIEPDNPTALSNLGQMLCDSGDPDRLEEAETFCRRAATVAPALPQAHEYLGNVLRTTGRPELALKSYQQAIRADRRRVMPFLQIGHLLQEAGRYDEAERMYQTARAIDADDARLHVNLGSLALARDQYEEAAAAYRSALELDPSSIDAHRGLGLTYLEQGRSTEAEACFGEVLAVDPNNGLALAGLARLLAERGDLDESCVTARRRLAVRANLADAYNRLALNLKGRLPEDDVEAIKRLLDHKSLPAAARSLLRFGLAAVYNDRSLYREASALLEDANRLQGQAKMNRRLVFDPDQHATFIDRFISTFTPGAIDRARGWVEPDSRPVFVVGLPRSGTTLVEQILASHAQVHGAGELFEAHGVFHSLPRLVGQPTLDSFSAFGALEPASARAAARRYLDFLARAAPTRATRIVNKMPDNYRLIGLIAVLWPGARVIVCRRDPRDMAISCWQTGFESNPWTNDPEHIGRRIADTERLMRHWQATKPLEWLEVRYEDVVQHFESNAHRLVNFVGLEWDPACLEFYKTRRVVRTASITQVRQPIYSHSVGKWRHYAPYIKPLLDALKRHGVVADDEADTTALPAALH